MSAAEAMPYVVMLALFLAGMLFITLAGNHDLAQENRRLLDDLDDAVDLAAGKDVTIGQQRSTIQRLRRTNTEHEATIGLLLDEVGPLGPTDTLARWEAGRALTGWSE